jgi:hypothetical protein
MMNSWNAAQAAGAAGHPALFIGYTPSARVSPGGWSVISPEFKTEPGGHWMHHGHKYFMGNRDSEALQEAMDWASKKYGVKEWVKVPGFKGDYFPAEAVPAIKAALKADKARAVNTQG